MTRSTSADDVRPPIAEKRPTSRVVHGVAIHDDYAWLKADNWKEVLRDASRLPAGIADHLRRENAYTDATLAGLDGLRADLVREMRARMVEDESSVPRPDGPFSYFTRYREGGQHPLACRVGRSGGSNQPDEIVLDGDREAGERAYFELADIAHSPDHRLLAWSADVTGAELYTIRVRDLATGRDRDDEIRASSGEVVWAASSEAFYYVEVDDNHRPVRVRHHRLGTSAAEDRLVYEEGASGWFVAIGQTSSRRFMTIRVSDHETSEVWLLDLAAGEEEPRVVAPRSTPVT